MFIKFLYINTKQKTRTKIFTYIACKIYEKQKNRLTEYAK